MSKIKLVNVPINFAKLFVAEGYQGAAENKKFSAEFYLDPTKPDHKKSIKNLRAAIDQCGSAQWPDKWTAGKGMKGVKGYCLKSGDEELFSEPLVSEYEPESGELPQRLEGKYIVRASESTRPTVVNRDKSPLTAEDAVIYDGCHVTAIISLWAQDNKFGKRINANLVGVQFKGDGTPFAGTGEKANDDDFDDDDFEEEDDL